MRAAAILGPGNFHKHLAKFRNIGGADWTVGALDLPDQAEVAVIFGGDGTIRRHLSTLVNLQTPVLVVPCGSGNVRTRAQSGKVTVAPCAIQAEGLSNDKSSCEEVPTKITCTCCGTG